MLSSRCHYSGTTGLTHSAPSDSRNPDSSGNPDPSNSSLFDKATSTLAARPTPVSEYLSWQRDAGATWPPNESDAYEFLKSYATPYSPASRANAFLEALRFIRYTLGFRIGPAIESRRIAGYAAEQSQRLGTREQTPPFSLQIVSMTERDLCMGKLATG